MKDSKPTEYLSHYYEYTCDKCKQAIKKNTVYFLQKREGTKDTEFYRLHKECLNIAGKCNGYTPAS